MTPMPTSRYGHSCGLITGPAIVAAGGRDSGLSYLDSVDIYSVDTDSWREGNVNQNQKLGSQCMSNLFAFQPILYQNPSPMQPVCLMTTASSSLEDGMSMVILQTFTSTTPIMTNGRC